MPEERLPVARILQAAGAIAGAIGTALLVVLAILLGRGLPFGGIAVRPPAAPASAIPAPAPLAQAAAPLQAAPQTELARYRAEKTRALETLSWTDAARTTARVPIDVAMALLAASAAAPAPHAGRAASLPAPSVSSPGARASQEAL
jgi:hypothetical protein